MMSNPVTTISSSGQRTERLFFPPYCKDDFVEMQRILGDAELQGWAATRIIGSDCIRVSVLTKEQD